MTAYGVRLGDVSDAWEGSERRATSREKLAARRPARVYGSEAAAIEAIKASVVQAGDCLVLAGCGPTGTGMEETYQLTSALKYISWGKTVLIVTDARFSGVSTGACVGHVGPEALAGGPLGKLRDGDEIEIVVDRNKLEGSINYVGDDDLDARSLNERIAPHPDLPDDTRIWALDINVLIALVDPNHEFHQKFGRGLSPSRVHIDLARLPS